MASQVQAPRSVRLSWISTALAAIGFAMLGAFWAGTYLGGAPGLGPTESWPRLLASLAVGAVTGAIGGWSMLRAPRATIFVFVIGLVTSWFLLLCVGLLMAPLLPARARPEVEATTIMATPEPGSDGAARSERACPVCGAHRLRAVTPPRVDVQGVQPWLDLYAMGDMDPHVPPEIVCEACDSSWPNVEAFEAAAG
jgi:branched-subunit amino acid transport protein